MLILWILIGVALLIGLGALAFEAHRRAGSSGSDDEGSDGNGDGGDGGGGVRRQPPPSPVTGGDGPSWWPEFEREFAAYVQRARAASGRSRAVPGPPK